MRPLLRLSHCDVDHATVGLVTIISAGTEILDGIGQPLVVLVLIRIGGCAGSRIADCPKLFYEFVACVVITQIDEGVALIVADDPANVLLQPFLVGLRKIFCADREGLQREQGEQHGNCHEFGDQR